MHCSKRFSLEWLPAAHLLVKVLLSPCHDLCVMNLWDRFVGGCYVKSML